MGGDELGWRGLIAQSTDLDALAAEADKGPITLSPARPDRAQPARGIPGAAAGTAPLPAGRPPAHRSCRRRGRP